MALGGRPQPAANNGVRDGKSNLIAVTPHLLQGSTPERQFSEYKSVQPLPLIRTFRIRDKHLAHAVTQGKY